MILLSESKIDYKYSNIYNRIDNLEPLEGTFLFLMKKLISSRNSIYHIRYIKYKNFISSFSRLLIIFLISRISQSKIVWTCHNIYEHNIPSKRANIILRLFITTIVSDIIVFHEDLLKYLPKNSLKKTTVACFGDFKSFIENQKVINNDFKDKYHKWLKSKKSSYPNIVSISAAKKNNLKLLIDGVANTQINTLIIAPNSKIEVPKEASNIFIYRNFVFSEVKTILNTKNNFIGFIGHENISVPTSLYMYASYKIPIIAFNIEPVNSIITMYQLGISIKNPQELEKAYYTILDNYDTYVENVLFFLKENSWEKSALVHRDIFI